MKSHLKNNKKTVQDLIKMKFNFVNPHILTIDQIQEDFIHWVDFTIS